MGALDELTQPIARAKGAFDDLTTLTPQQAEINKASPSTGDYLRSLAAGVNNVITTAGEGARLLGADETGTAIRDFGASGEQFWQDKMTAAGKSAAAGDLENHLLSTLGLSAAQSLPGMAAMAVPGFGLTKAAEVVTSAPKIAGALTGLGVGAERAGRIAAAVPSAVGMGAAEGVYSGLSNAAQTAQEIAQIPIEDLAKLPSFQRFYDQTDMRLPRPARLLAARDLLSQEAERAVTLETTASTGTIGALTGGGVLGQLARPSQGFVKGALSGIKSEAVQEFLQSGGEQAIQNIVAREHYDPQREIAQDVLKQAVIGAGAGGILGGLGGGVHGAAALPPREDTVNLQDLAAAAPSRPAAPAADGPTPFDTTLRKFRDGIGFSAAEREALLDARLAKARPDGSLVLLPAGKRRLKQLETDTGVLPESNAEDDTLFNTEKKPAAQEEAKPVELIEGGPTTFSTERGTKLEGRYAAVEADDLVASHDEALKPNEAYPQELQPRDRSRDASELQVAKIAQNLQPEFLGASPQASQGSPIIGADGVVESGNARSIALKRAYWAGAAEHYKQWLVEHAAEFGLDAQKVVAMQRPVLARVRTTDVNRAEFARQANESAVAQFSPLEQANSDAARLTHMDDLVTGENGELQGLANTPFIRRFVSMLPVTEQAALVTGKGQLSQAGATRIRNAVLARAYGGGETLMRMVESTDDNVRNITNGLVRAAPAVAKTREAIAEGALHSLDITEDLLKAAEQLSVLRANGNSVGQFLAQISFYDEAPSAEYKALLEWLDANARSGKRVADFINAYLEAIAAAGNPAQASMFDGTVPSKADLVEQAKKGVGNEPEQHDLLRAGAGQAAEAGASEAQGDRGQSSAGLPGAGGVEGPGGGQPGDQAGGDRSPGQGDAVAKSAEENPKKARPTKKAMAATAPEGEPKSAATVPETTKPKRELPRDKRAKLEKTTQQENQNDQPKPSAAADEATSKSEEEVAAGAQRASPDASADRRHDTVARKAVAAMSREEMRLTLLTDELTGLGNRRAYNESEKQAVQTLIDADSLKWVNDKLGHQSGDEMLRLIGHAISEETQNGYRIGGDEFVIQAKTAEESHAIMAKVQARLAGAMLTVENVDGSKVELNGLGVSYGQGSSIAEADVGLRKDKLSRQRSGTRADRGQKPPGATEKAAEGKQDRGRVVAAEEIASAGAETATIDESAHEAATSPQNDKPNPTKAQIEAGNAELGHIRVAGMDLSIENPEGSVREDKHNTPPKWRTTMRDHYGYIKGTVGFDKDHLDVFVKPGTVDDFSGFVYVVNQNNKGNGQFDEHKAMFGYDSESAAKAAYLAYHEKGWESRIRSIVAMPMDEFKAWAFDKENGPSKGEANANTDVVVSMQSGTFTMGAVPSFQEAKATAEKLPRDEYVPLRIDRKDSYGEPEPARYAAWVGNGDGTAAYVERTFPESRKPLDREAILQLASEVRTREAQLAEKQNSGVEKRKRQIEEKGIKEGVTWTDATAYVEGRKTHGITKFSKATVTKIDDSGAIHVTAILHGARAPYQFTTTPDSRLFDNYPAPKSGEVTKPIVNLNEPAAADKVDKAVQSKNGRNVDVGENLWYNRRNFTGKALAWDQVKGLNDTLKVKEVVKSKVWPRPDYEQLVSDGLQPFFARLAKQVYDGIAVAPSGKTDADLQRYIDVVGRVRNAVFDWAKDNNANRAFLDAVVSRAKPMAQRGPISVSSLGNQVGDMTNVILDRVWPDLAGKPGRFRTGEPLADIRAIGGNRALQAMQFTLDDAMRAMKDLENGWPKSQEAWQRQGYRVLAPDNYTVQGSPMTRYVDGKPIETGEMYWRATPKNERGSFSRRGGEELMLDKFLLVRKGRIISEHATEEQAKEAAREVTKREGASTDLRGMNIGQTERVGTERRGTDEDVSSERLMGEFGFRGVNFGREGWINQAERQAYLNHAYDALLDLAEILDVPPKALSLNGMLGIAFGAQGRGGNAAAHFVPGVNEINLTKTKGAGTLAHEWGHALDHYFAAQAGLAKRTDPFLSEHTGIADGEIRPEIVSAFKTIVQGMNLRDMTEAESKARTESAKKMAAQILEHWIKNIGQKFDYAAAVPAKNPAGREAARAEFDQFAARLRRGDLGEGYVKSGNKQLPQVIALIRNLYKESHGHLMNLADIEGLASAASSVRYYLGNKEAANAHIEQTATKFASESRLADREKGGKSYWSTEHEKFARAFETYVADRLAEIQQKNTFLSDAAMRAEMRDRSGNGYAYPYPRGEDRARINAAIDKLVQAVESKETENGIALFSRSSDLAFASDVLSELAGVDELFRYPISQSSTLEGVFSSVYPGATYLGDVTRADEKSESGADHRFMFRSPQGRDFYVFEAGKDVWLDVSRFEEGDMGSAVYAAVLNYAYNTKKRLIGDPSGLSEAAVVRRTNAMLSSALRFGTTRHMEAAPEQLKGIPGKGIAPLDWSGDDVAKVRSMVDTIVSNLYHSFPGLKEYHYDFRGNRLVDSRGRPVDAARLDAGKRHPDARASRAGQATLRRGIFLQSLVSSEGGERPGILEQALNGARELVTNGGLTGSFSRAKVSSASTVESIRDELGAQISKSKASRVRVVQTLAGLPKKLRDYAYSKNAFDAQGVFDPGSGTIYLIAGKIKKGAAFAVLMHEAGVHRGLADLIGKDGVATLARQIRSWARSASVDSEHGRIARIAVGRVPRNTSRSMRGEESIAYFIEEAAKAGYGVQKSEASGGAVSRWFRQLWALVKAAVTKLGADPSSLTVDDVVALARGALERTLGGRAATGQRLETAQARGPAASRSAELAPAFQRGAVRYAEDAEGRPLLSGSRVAIVNPGLSREESDGTRIYNHAIVADGKTVGVVTLGWKSGKVRTLYFIYTESNLRRSGLAEDAVRSILEHNGPGVELHASLILRQARPFWSKLGAEYVETDEGADGFLTIERYDAARGSGAVAFGRDEAFAQTGSEEDRPGSGNAGVQEGDEVVAPPVFSRVVREEGISAASAEPISSFDNADDIKAHPDYVAAKAGDTAAAVRLVQDLVKPEQLEEARKRFGPDVVFLPVMAKEATGHNQIPNALAALYAQAVGDAKVPADSIIQSNEAHHTGARPMERILARPVFDGPVESGRSYVLVDDVTTMGSTFAELANHIRAGGGDVTGIIVLVDARRGATMAASRQQTAEIERRFGDEIRQLEIEPSALTGPEAGYLLNFKDADALRATVATAIRERGRRLAAKGISETPDSPRFSRNRDGNRDLSSATLADQTAEIAGSARQVVGDLLQSQRTFNRWWHTTVGTQYHKATIDRDFKRVFDIGQAYLTDTSRYAMMAEDHAPDLLIRMEGWKDVLKRGISKADKEAIQAPIFSGTVEDKTVYSPEELRDQFGLTPKQIGYYQQFRASVDLSLDELAKSMIVKMARAVGVQVDGVAALREQGLYQFYREVSGMIRLRAKGLQDAVASVGGESDSLAQKKADEVNAQLEAVGDLYDRVTQLKIEGYAPLMRFGEYTVYVQEPNEQGDLEQVFFGMYETQREANAAARELKAEYPDAVVTQGILSKQAWRVFQGLSPDTVELFAKAAGLDKEPLFQSYLRLAVNNRSALTRLMKRKGTPGFATDPTRVLASFVTSNARLTSSNYNLGEMQKAVDTIPDHKGDVKDEAVRLWKYLTDPQEEAGALRGFLFFNYLGGSIASALVNATQPVTMTAPYLAQFASAGAVATALTQASIEAAKGEAGTDVRAAYNRATDEGIIAPHEIYQLMAEARGNVLGSTHMGRFMKVWGSFFSLAEAFNRRATFIAAYRLAPEGQDAYDFAAKAVHETQGIYSKVNRPNWGRGAVGATVMTFKQFSVAYIEFLRRLQKDNPKAFAIAVAVMFAAAGAEGLPFAEDAEDIIDTIGQWLGHATNTKKWLRHTAAEAFGDGAGQFVLHGFSAIPGVPLDVSSRMGLQNLIPGTAMLKQSETDKTRDIAEFVGPLGGVITAAGRSLEAAAKGDIGGAMRPMLPRAVENLLKGAEMWEKGYYTDSKGRRVIDTTQGEAILKAAGFQPSSVASESRKIGAVQQDISLLKVKEAGIAEKWARGVVDNRPELIDEARDELREWNTQNPDATIRLLPAQIRRRVQEARKTREERFVKTAPPEMRGEARKELAR